MLLDKDINLSFIFDIFVLLSDKDEEKYSHFNGRLFLRIRYFN